MRKESLLPGGVTLGQKNIPAESTMLRSSTFRNTLQRIRSSIQKTTPDSALQFDHHDVSDALLQVSPV